MRIVVNNVVSKVEIGGKDNLLSVNLMNELRKYLRVRPKGYNFSPKFKKHQWDGWRYFITKKGNFATGFLPLVYKFVRDLGAEVDIIDNRKNLPLFRKDIFTDYIGTVKGVDWYARGKYEFQLYAVKSIERYVRLGGQELYFPRGIINGATNAGKTSIIALLLRNLEPDFRGIFLVSSQDIFKQTVELYKEIFGDDYIGEIRSGKYAPAKFTIAMYKTLYNRAKENMNVRNYLAGLDLLVVDESDEAGAKQYATVLGYINAGMRVFVSGTPFDGKPVQNMVAIGLSGTEIFKVTNQELIELEVSQKPEIKILLNFVGYHPTYDEEYENVVIYSEERIKKIAEIIRLHDNEPVLVTFTNIRHGEFMQERLQRFLPHLDIAIAHGETDNRKEIIDDFKSGKIKVLLASQIFQRGINIPNIRVLVMAHGGKSVRVLKQYVGRALRHDGDNDRVFIYDFYDVGHFVGKHSRDRIRAYKNEGFEVKEMYKHRRGKPILE